MARGAKETFNVKFYGVRGSFPAPGKDTARYGGNTSCVEVRAGGHIIILDAGTGMIGLGDDMVKEFVKDEKPMTAYIFISHMHHDHIFGFPFFKPAYIGSTKLYVYGPKGQNAELKDILARNMSTPFFPVEFDELKSQNFIQTIHEAEVVILEHGHHVPKVRHVFRHEKVEVKDPVVITVLKHYNHPRDGVYVYKIRYQDKSMVFATDVEGFVGGDMRLVAFAKGADLLIHDAQYVHAEYTKLITGNTSYVQSIQGYGHSTAEIALEVAQKAEVKQLAMYHHDPSHTDAIMDKIEKDAKKKFKKAFAAREGMTVELL